MFSLDKNSQADVITAFNNTPRYWEDILNLNNPFFDNLISSIYPKELILNKANNSDTSAAFLDLDLSIDNAKISLKNTTKGTTLISTSSISLILMEMFLDLHLTVCSSLSLFVLPERVLLWKFSIREIK